MLIIAGNGMGEYDFSNLDLEFCKFDRIVCDKNFKEDDANILKLGFKDAKEYILTHYDKEKILYVVTGSPLFFSAGSLIAKHLPKDKVKIINNTSSKDYLLEKLMISENEVGVVSLHGRKRVDLREFFRERYTFVLCDEKSIERLKEVLKYLKKDNYTVTIGYKLGYSDEVIKEIDLDISEFNLKEPYILLFEKRFEVNVLSEDSEFETQRGMITKKLKRAVTLQSLDLMPNEVLWDVGSGSGSCAIEAYKRYKVKTYLFEKNPKRVEFIKQNLTNHKVIDTHLFEGNAEDFFDDIEENPDKIFVGGGGSEVIKKLPYLHDRLNKGGKMLISAITLKNLTQMIQVLDDASLEYEVNSYSLTSYKGKLNMIEPQRMLFNILLEK